MIIKNPPPIINTLTPEERAWVMNLYSGCAISGDRLSFRLILNQIQHMPDADVFMLCYWVDSTPFVRVKQDKWRIERGYDTIEVRGDIYAYHIVINTGNVHVYVDGRLIATAHNGYAVQFHMKHYYAFPIFFEKGHWANGKNAFQLGLAVPNMQPIYDTLLRLFDQDEEAAEGWLFDKRLHGVDLNSWEVYNNELIEINKQLAHKS